MNKWSAMEQVIGKRVWMCKNQPPQISISVVTVPSSIHYRANERSRVTEHTSDDVQTTKEPKDVFAGNRDSEKQLRNLRRHAKQFQQKEDATLVIGKRSLKVVRCYESHLNETRT